ncbi:membrane protein [Cupriavidus sp. SK-3]|uniref:DMT family transporter n=1 Tax=unclassified Cupriavidus TaxID=2640874 RepID=UPI00044AADEB|nr:DMT family transporter [Cupriavidus sp. SK-3]KDP89175.1 membrane protein [Cupriavidus sp. SK-3]
MSDSGHAGAAGWWRGGLIFLCAVALFATVDATAKHLVGRYPAPFLNAVRYAVTASVAIAMLAGSGRLRFWRTPHRGLLALRGVMLALVGTCFMTALLWMPLAEATAIYFMSPLVIVALSPWLLGERVGPRKWVAVAAGFAGMLLIVRPGGQLSAVGTVLMVAAAVAYALLQLLTRRLAGKVEAGVQYGFAAVICMIATGLPAPFFLPAAWPGMADWLAILAMGFMSAIAQVLLILALQRAPASTVAPLNYCHLLLALVYSALWFGRWPDGPAMAGIALIIAAGLSLTLPLRGGVRAGNRLRSASIVESS